MKKLITMAVCCVVILALLASGLFGVYHYTKVTKSNTADNETDTAEEVAVTEQTADDTDVTGDDQASDEELSEEDEELAQQAATAANETKYFVLPSEMKTQYSGKYYNRETVQLVNFETEYPEDKIAWKSYSEYADQREPNKVPTGIEHGMSDAVSTAFDELEKLGNIWDKLTPRIQLGEIQKWYREFYTELTNNPALLVCWADFLANHVLFDDETTLGDAVPDLLAIVEENDWALQNYVTWRKNAAEMRHTKKTDPRYEELRVIVEETPDNGGLVGVRGVEYWCEASEDDPTVAERNEWFERSAMVVINVFKSFETFDHLLLIDADVNYHIPSRGDDLGIVAVLNKNAVHRQYILPFGKTDKDGKICMLFGADVRDKRPELKVEEYVYQQRVAAAQKKTTTQKSSGTSNGGGSGGGGGGGSTVTPPADDKPDNNKPDNKPSQDKPKDKPTDGNGIKDATADPVANGNANDVGGTRDGGKGEATEKPQTPTGDAATVVSGSEDSGSRTINDNADKPGEGAHNGSSDNKDTTTPASGTVDSGGATIDSGLSGNGSDEHVDEAPAHGDEGGSTQGWSMSDDMGD